MGTAPVDHPRPEPTLPTCIPHAFWSWRFDVVGARVAPVRVEFRLLGEQGSIEYGTRVFAVRKHGLTSGRWTLEDPAGVHTEATKSSAFSRRFVVHHAGIDVELAPRSWLGRTFDLRLRGRHAGDITPAHAWTRRTELTHDASIPEPTALFCFWLAALTWRRRTRRD